MSHPKNNFEEVCSSNPTNIYMLFKSYQVRKSKHAGKNIAALSYVKALKMTR